MQEALLTDPDVAANLHLVLVIAAQDGVVADIHIAPDRNVLGMKSQSSVFEDDILAEHPELGRVNGADPAAAELLEYGVTVVHEICR